MDNALTTHPLTYVRERNGWGKAELARLLCRRGRLLGIALATNRTTVWKWENGQEPDADAQHVLADLLGVDRGLIKSLGWPGWLPAWEKTSLLAPWTRDGTVSVFAELVRSGHMDRRGFLSITGSALAGVAANWAAAPEAFASAVEGDRVTDDMVTTLETRVATLRTLDDQMGGARLLEQATGDLSLITSLLEHGTYTSAVEQRLYGMAARVSYLAGWMAYDKGLRSLGQRYYVASLRSSRTADDTAFGAFMLAEMGVHVSDSGDTAQRVNLIDTAIDNAPTALPPAVASYLHLHHAEALSRDGQHEAAGKALNRAYDRFGGHQDGDQPDWLAWYGEAQLKSTEGKILLRSGFPERATTALALSVDQAVPRDKAVRSGRLATARLASRDLDGALDAATIGLALLEGKVRSDRARSRLTKFSGYLEPHADAPAVREFRERLRALPVAA
ncbi:transcriptional regulator [Streptomyces venezuelae]|uniref:Transcriptional regulator n=1 Tax=Streptomyces venezuelae TaxID=54571 RepID=A0A5P2DQU8_STRVZ|nr:transcriptional regulator [Streptomyces venezuelae]QES57213.1 transcriptional regulator [Streptomyces venezuelae]